MSIVTLAEAKLHCRVDHNDEDTLFQVYLDAAELSVSEFMDRGLYADSTALNAATAAVPAALTAATAAYDAAMAAAALISNEVERGMAENRAQSVYEAAQVSARRAYAGIVINAAIRGAVLLMVGNHYANREAVSTVNAAEAPMAVKWLLTPYRVEMGV